MKTRARSGSTSDDSYIYSDGYYEYVENNSSLYDNVVLDGNTYYFRFIKYKEIWKNTR